MNLNTTKLFASGFFIFLSLGLLSQLFFDNASIDLQIYDTYMVINYKQIFFVAAMVLGFYAVIYYLFPIISGRSMNVIIGNIHFWSTILMLPIICFLLINYWVFREKANWGGFSLITIVFVVFFQLLFVFNLVYSFVKGEKVQK